PGGSSDTTYVSLLVVSFIIIFALPFIIYACSRKGNKTNVSMIHIKSHNAPKGHFFIHPRARSTHYLVPIDKTDHDSQQQK
ncbi:TPA: glutamate:gamma-aminobutyrate antiporter, partial [Proteus mirabilis]|nr:glutamate:gamma-aminobutyrate antiporter [Proteus mirabilis]